MSHKNREFVEKCLLTTEIVDEWTRGEKETDILSKNPVDEEYWGVADIREAITPAVQRIIRSVREIISESREGLDEKIGDKLERLEYQVQYGLNQDCVDFAINGIAFRRGFVKHLRYNLEIKDPQDILKYPVSNDLNLERGQFIKLKKRAIYEYLSGYKKEKELCVIKAAENHYETDFFRQLMESSEGLFEDSVIMALNDLDMLKVIEADQEGEKPEPECRMKIRGEKGYRMRNGNTLEVGVECKSKQNHDEVVSVGDALEIIKKAPSCQIKLTVGAPDFAKGAAKSAEDHEVLLMSAPTFAEFYLQAKKGDLDSEKVEELLNSVGKMSRRDVINQARK